MFIIRTPVSTASVVLPGIPSVRSGISAPPTELLLAASNEATPSRFLLPNSSGCFLVLLLIF